MLAGAPVADLAVVGICAPLIGVGTAGARFGRPLKMVGKTLKRTGDGEPASSPRFWS